MFNLFLRSGENDVEYNHNMELEEGDIVEEAASAAAGASGMNGTLFSLNCILVYGACFPSFSLFSHCHVRGNAELCILQDFLFLELLHHVPYVEIIAM